MTMTPRMARKALDKVRHEDDDHALERYIRAVDHVLDRLERTVTPESAVVLVNRDRLCRELVEIVAGIG
ncbi:hypothetical protein GCM10025787_03430 [Saccharopolyspora rosea]|uniref:Uncharacterized protein n=1 Tax=Saccharopolyspora rosea TaxID=524884 RepID=A0ABW3FNI3_9PSEU